MKRPRIGGAPFGFVEVSTSHGLQLAAVLADQPNRGHSAGQHEIDLFHENFQHGVQIQRRSDRHVDIVQSIETLQVSLQTFFGGHGFGSTPLERLCHLVEGSGETADFVVSVRQSRARAEITGAQALRYSEQSSQWTENERVAVPGSQERQQAYQEQSRQIAPE